MSVIFSFNSQTITLPSPQFGDQLNKHYRTIIRESRGKELIVAPRNGYTQLIKYEYKFEYINEILKQSLISFLDASLGAVVAVTDYNDNHFNALILTPSADIINSSRNNNEITLELERI